MVHALVSDQTTTTATSLLVALGTLFMDFALTT